MSPPMVPRPALGDQTAAVAEDGGADHVEAGECGGGHRDEG